jgi:hypothetical protein
MRVLQSSQLVVIEPFQQNPLHRGKPLDPKNHNIIWSVCFTRNTKSRLLSLAGDYNKVSKHHAFIAVLRASTICNGRSNNEATSGKSHISRYIYLQYSILINYNSFIQAQTHLSMPCRKLIHSCP